MIHFRHLAALAILGPLAGVPALADDPKPLRVLLVTGGCCHDYTNQKDIIAKGLAERAFVEVTAVQQGGTTTTAKIPLYENADWSKGYDVVIHDECFSDAKDTAWTGRILAPHKAGLPAVVVHCAMHCYRDGSDDWFKFCGVTSRRHGAAYGHEVLNVDAAHSIMKGFGPAWANPAGELYWIEKVWPTAHTLATSKNREKGNDETCVWTNQYEKARVFGTTLGHHNETVSSPAFLDLLTRGTLWAADKLDSHLRPKVAATVYPGDASKLAGVKAPEGFEVSLFAAPPAVSYPVFVAAAPNGDLYVSCDRNGSLDKEPNRGSVVRLRDLDGDGKADEAKRFIANVDCPRGLVFDRDRLYLMHPPHLSAFIDKDGDGVADEEKILVKDIAFTYRDRPGDHTSNGVTLGIDGWLYLAIGDFGFLNAEGTDGRKLQLRGGGVVRVRPDGTGLELYSRGTRNILEVAIDPLLNMFARDNTNDGGGWDIRLHHFTGMDDHGYPSLFKNFASEVVPPLADYGGGSGCGSLYLSEPGFPEGYGDALYTADWGRDKVYRHKMTPKGATFTADQTEFLTVPRVTDLDVDAMGHIFVSSWKGATFNFAGENVGYILRVTPKGNKPEPLPDYARLDKPGLVKQLDSPSHRRRLEAQRELIRRGIHLEGDNEAATLLRDMLANKPDRPIANRVAALFTLRECLNVLSTEVLAVASRAPFLREFALRGLTDRLDRLDGAAPRTIAGLANPDPISRRSGVDELFSKETWSSKGSASELAIALLKDSSPRVRRQASVSLARLGRPEAVKQMTPLLGDPDPIVRRTAATAIINLKGAEACLADFDRATSPPLDSGRLIGTTLVLQGSYDPGLVDPLIHCMESGTTHARRLLAFAILCRLDHREGFWSGESWGTRPDTSGPYYQPEPWEATPKIEAALKATLASVDAETFPILLHHLDRNKVDLKGGVDLVLARAKADPSLIAPAVEHLSRRREIPANAVPLLLRVARGNDAPMSRAQATEALLKVDNDESLNAALDSLARLESEGPTSAAFLEARTAFLAGTRSPARRKLLESVAVKIDGPRSAWAEAALLAMNRDRRGTDPSAEAWSNPKRRAQWVHAVGLAEHRPSSSKIIAALSDADPLVASAARETARRLNLDANGDRRPTGPKLGSMPVDAALAAATTTVGDIQLGERVFNRLACINCHTTRASDPPRGPYLGTIATTYKRRELAEAVLVPSKTIAQGFATNVFELDDGRSLTGFVVKEAADGVTLRDAEGKEHMLTTEHIVDRVKSSISVMPEGQMKDLTVGEFAGLLAYLESLAKGRPAH